ncbi:MAG TPA: YebC/PmpR family DNA-binding transcriptional regulator [Candidatus Babeliales bacterium]|nr:YebC/PmpR family DNA-binding transcriptional regulator [Candidatus Babeliales bacterium]
MSGHSHWATIKHKKAKEDAKRGKVFTKIIKEITIAAKQGGGDPAGNPRLRDLVDKAKDVNMPQENITRAIKKGTGELPGVIYESQKYEGYGPGGIAIIVETLTDNKNRTVANVRHIFSAKGGNLGEIGSVNWMFEKKGVIQAANGSHTEDELLEHLIDYNASDISVGPDFIQVTCDDKDLGVIKAKLQKLGLKIEQAEIEWVAKTSMSLDSEVQTKAIEFLSALEEIDDVQNVYTNLG